MSITFQCVSCAIVPVAPISVCHSVVVGCFVWAHRCDCCPNWLRSIYHGWCVDWHVRLAWQGMEVLTWLWSVSRTFCSTVLLRCSAAKCSRSLEIYPKSGVRDLLSSFLSRFGFVYLFVSFFRFDTLFFLSKRFDLNDLNEYIYRESKHTQNSLVIVESRMLLKIMLKSQTIYSDQFCILLILFLVPISMNFSLLNEIQNAINFALFVRNRFAKLRIVTPN